jgi:hypothetical protein
LHVSLPYSSFSSISACADLLACNDPWLFFLVLCTEDFSSNKLFVATLGDIVFMHKCVVVHSPVSSLDYHGVIRTCTDVCEVNIKADLFLILQEKLHQVGS